MYIKDYLHPYVEDGHIEAKPLRIYYHKRWVSTVHSTVQKVINISKKLIRFIIILNKLINIKLIELLIFNQFVNIIKDILYAFKYNVI